ncbi:MAG TPA: aminotransferase class III-fold pyridoxal phosphate-dependent enzyme [Euzebyales bacterium]
MDLDEALDLALRRYVDAHPRSRALHERARRVLPGGNTRTVLHFEPFAFRVERADGAHLVDVDGHRRLDVLGDYSAGLLGHQPQAVADAVRDRLDTGWALGGMTEPEIAFAEAVVDRFASIDQVRFTNSGTEANLMAIMTARHATGRDRVVVFAGGYHGGLLYYGPTGAPLRAPFEHGVLDYNDVDALERELTVNGERIACVLVEPMLGASGCIPATAGFLDALRSGTRDVGAVLIFDEVMTSRLAPGGAQQLTGVTPDMTTLGKYVAGGMTFGAFGGRRDLMTAFDPEVGGLAHAGTFNNNTFTMAAGVEVQRIVTRDGYLERLSARGDRLRQRLADVFDASPLAFRVTGWGSLGAIHPVAGPVTHVGDLADADDRWRRLLFHHLLDAGYYTAPRGYMALSAALTGEDIDGFVVAVEAFCDRYGALG